MNVVAPVCGWAKANDILNRDVFNPPPSENPDKKLRE